MALIADHIAVPSPKRDLEWLKESLQTAIALEQSTLPLYLAAMYSLKVQNYTTYNLIRSVAMEEMVHMAIGCNLLAAIGGSPRIKNLDAGFPRRGLPGGAEPDLSIGLAQLSRQQLKSFMRIELPSFLLPERYKHEAYPTIGKLYGAIREAFAANADAVRRTITQGGTSNQVGDDIGFTTISDRPDRDPLPQIEAAIDEIVEFEDEASHYCKFAEIYYGQRYSEADGVELTPETESQFFRGYPLRFPEVVNTLRVPSDGYTRLLAEDPAGGEVEASLAAFDQAYRSILNDLDSCWNGPASQSWPTLGKAVTMMGSLRVLAGFNIVTHEIPSSLVARLAELYPDEHAELAAYTNLDTPVFYGPRFRNLGPTEAGPP